MPDLVIVPALVLPGEGAQYISGTAGAALSAGDVCFLDGPTQQYLLADSSDALKAKVRGIASCSAAPGQPVRVQTGGVVNLGSALLSVAEVYVLSGLTPGKIAPIGDLAPGDFVVILGIGQTTSLLQLKLWITELTKAA